MLRKCLKGCCVQRDLTEGEGTELTQMQRECAVVRQDAHHKAGEAQW
jgi:hypothetical protein